MARLFGTDGVRGIAITELTTELTMNIGRAAAMVLKKRKMKKLTFLIGKDTRISSDTLEAALVAGITSVGADVKLLGVVPTPAVALLVKLYGADAGIMISASHNTVEYNGIKIFSGDGFKLTDDEEDEIESITRNTQSFELKMGGDVGRVKVLDTAVSDYVAHIKSTVKDNFNGLKILIDSANGSASATANNIFSSLSDECEFLFNQPNGININDNCGSTHIYNLKEKVINGGFDCGLAFDGDADRCLAVDEKGNEVDGDKIMVILAEEMKKNNTLSKNTVVGTVMSNLGFHKYLKEQGIMTVSTKVGDRYVLEEILENGYSIGGEQSGHIILPEHATTGDGQLTAVQLLSALKASGKKLSQLVESIPDYPQTLIGVYADSDKKAKWDKSPNVINIIKEAEKAMGENGRILVRASGTEPLIRIMIEGKDENEVKMWAKKIAGIIENEI